MKERKNKPANLKFDISQLQNGMRRIQDNDLDFSIKYSGDDELGKLCSSMEKMRKELRHNNKTLWEMLQQRKLLNTSVAHDLRTPITVLRGYLDFLEKNIPQDKLTEEMLMDTVSSMQGAVLRLERYAECVRDVEKIESIEIRREPQDTRKRERKRAFWHRTWRMQASLRKAWRFLSDW